MILIISKIIITMMKKVFADIICHMRNILLPEFQKFVSFIVFSRPKGSLIYSHILSKDNILRSLIAIMFSCGMEKCFFLELEVTSEIDLHLDRLIHKNRRAINFSFKKIPLASHRLR